MHRSLNKKIALLKDKYLSFNNGTSLVGFFPNTAAQPRVATRRSVVPLLCRCANSYERRSANDVLVSTLRE